MNILQSKNKLKFFNGKLQKHVSNEVETLAWKKCDYLIMTWLQNSIHPFFHDLITYLKSLFEMWKDLNERFEHTNEPRVHEM